MDYNNMILDILNDCMRLKENMKDLAPIINNIAQTIASAYKRGNKVIIFGNGGSAADAQHIAAEFAGKYLMNRKPLPALALNTNTSSITAIANDFGYEEVFRRQVEGNLQDGDIVIGISTSGNSPNVIEALKFAKNNGGITVGLVGENKCKIDEITDHILKIPSKNTPRIQEGHITAGHIICNIVEKLLFSE